MRNVLRQIDEYTFSLQSVGVFVLLFKLGIFIKMELF